ncbi:MAG TPA: hypothetical protein VGL53_19160 [Bryobacteraceae bacterium]
MGWPTQVAIAADLNGQKYIFAANGPGPRLAARVLEAAEAEAGGELLIEAVISTGFCGALDPQLALGDIVEATSVIDLATGNQSAVRPASTNRAPALGPVLSMDRVAVTIEEKAGLRNTTPGALAVEMEASAVASWAKARHIPFYCIRVVSDRADSNVFPIDMNLMRDSEGRFDRFRIARHALMKPFARIPGLLALDRDCRLAETKLGEFFESCRFE